MKIIYFSKIDDDGAYLIAMREQVELPKQKSMPLRFGCRRIPLKKQVCKFFLEAEKRLKWMSGSLPEDPNSSS